MIIRSTGKRHGIEHKDSSRAERLRSDRVFLPFEEQTADEKTGANEESNRNPQLRWDEIMLKRIFHEKRHAEEKRQPADPREQFRAHKLLPIH